MGFRLLTLYGEQRSVSFTLKEKFRACIAEFEQNGEKIILAKPTTYYNLVGHSYQLIRDFYKIPADKTLIIHDELALPFGTLRSRQGGSDAGNNGIKSIISHGGDKSWRLRVGIMPDYPVASGSDFVLGNFSPSQQQHIGVVADATADAIEAFLAKQLEAHTVNTLQE